MDFASIKDINMLYIIYILAMEMFITAITGSNMSG